MKVLNLQCSQHHSFEGWFASEADFHNQMSRGFIECPMCADKCVTKLPSAPRLNLGARTSQQSSEQSGRQAPSSQDSVASPERHEKTSDSSAMALATGLSHAEQAQFLKALRLVLTRTENVGSRFADEARRMHYGEIEARNIRGQTTVREAAELVEEGIEVVPLPLLPGSNGTLQ